MFSGYAYHTWSMIEQYYLHPEICSIFPIIATSVYLCSRRSTRLPMLYSTKSIYLYINELHILIYIIYVHVCITALFSGAKWVTSAAMGLCESIYISRILGN